MSNRMTCNILEVLQFVKKIASFNECLEEGWFEIIITDLEHPDTPDHEKIIFDEQFDKQTGSISSIISEMCAAISKTHPAHKYKLELYLSDDEDEYFNDNIKIEVVQEA